MLGEEGCGTKSLQKRQRVQTSGRKSSSSGKYGGLPEMQGER